MKNAQDDKPRSIVDLAVERSRRRVGEYEARIRGVLDANRRALVKLFSSGVIFTRQGTRAGRDLLLAHQHLLKVVDVLAQLDDLGDFHGPRHAEVEALYEELDSLLERTSLLNTRTGDFLATLTRD